MTHESEVQNTVVLHGHVKWFDPTKGFGFVIADEGGADILLHANVLRNYGQSSVADGAGIEIEVQDTQRGRQAVLVRSITPPETPDLTGLSEEQTGEIDLENAGPIEPARVKWFDKGKGFGFANIFGSDEDVFIHIEVLRRSGLADLQPGEAICLRTVQGKRGKLALVVSAWDSAVN
ncbi:Cold shock-like protein CspC [Aliiroseovarius sp. xm-m-379]|nr:MULTISPECIES: cold shock domain-containing protein [Aliiroseovarius]NRP12106.1 Cold shock-like protein CspC [Aliiroseovarius sp. xm-d-517]NRP25334.1 Cold shock-like protein CspC [Aliiroseovarius sp. xm-m-379]NRP30938.1 Cold shock-like protein CspC [Aliiroseovarius sp. xm-m-314]NRP34133.1 Cold shock-like protein CspC [Aliiroseovarius sp. xm-a-104]NRP41400.1 Cold shock-like protein CspC [Aliiroseovarius sp. xm-m-339-2]